MTETSIGTAVGARQSTINRIKTGSMVPNWETGKALVDLAASMDAAANDPESPEGDGLAA
ncbi:MAG TPA: hypothetical protein VLC71_06045 [Thermomonas sp.]|nr:hypothetical protein [Thermomonas sp.]